MSKSKSWRKNAKAFYQNLNIPILFTDMNGNALFSNEELNELLLLDQNEILNSSIFQLFQKKSIVRVESLIDVTILSGEHGFFEKDMVLKKVNGRLIPVNVSAKYHKEKNNEFLMFCFHDLSEIKKYQREKENSLKEFNRISKLADIGRLTAGVAHELNNPLQIIQGFAENIQLLLGDDSLTEEELKSQIDPIILASDRMARIISTMMRMARDESIKTAPADLREVIENVLLLAKSSLDELDIRVEKNYTGKAVVKCDPNQIEQIIINIFNNARYALSKCSGEKIIKIKICSNNSGELDLSIWNNGPVIPEKIKGQIMTPFFTTKRVGEGAGLGLSLSYGIMKSHGGDLTFFSAENNGTEFCLKFPKTHKLNEPKHDSGIILVVDDEPLIREIISNKFEMFGFKVLEAENGETALNIISKTPDLDAVITDLKMPVMDGKTLIKNVKSKYPHLFLYACSGYSG